MKVRVLGCSGAIARDCRTTSFLIDGDVLVDAGTGVGDLALEEMKGIDHVLLTHSHLDHVAALPLMIDAIASQRSSPVKVHALPGTIAALKAHIFNNVIWPDFSRIPTPEAPFITFHEIQVGQTLDITGKRIEVLPAVHTVPAVGYAVTAGRGCWVFTGDTERNPAFWRRLNKMNVAALGNQVPQLHVHVIARFTTDPAWPNPVWGRGTAEPYDPAQMATTAAAVKSALGA